MTDIPEKCLKQHREVRFTISEQSSGIVFENDTKLEVFQVQVDNCVIRVGERCDWMLIVNGKNLSILIELKGSDLDKAIRQLTSAHAVLTAHLKRDRKWIIVYSGSPRTSTSVQIMKREVARNHGSRLLVESTGFRFRL